MGDLTRNFARSEFACGCGCGYDTISLDLVAQLQHLRNMIERPITISSGCRCRKWNLKQGGKENSAHLRGLAADILCTDSVTRWWVLDFSIPLFKRIGIGKDFIHVDIDQSLPQRICYLP